MSDTGYIIINGIKYSVPESVTDALSTQLQSLSNEVDSVEGDVSTLKTDMTTAKSNISTLQSDMTTAKSNITTLQGNVSTLNTSVSSAAHTATWGQINGTLSNQTDLNNSINSLQGQIDTFTALTDGSTTGDAELTNIRVDSTGHTYATAGDAVRAIDAQVNAMKTGFDGVEYSSPAAMVTGEDQKLQDQITGTIDDITLINPVSAKRNLTIAGYVESPSGAFRNSSDTHRTGFVPVKKDQKVYYSTLIVGGMYSVAFYSSKSAGSFVQGSTSGSGIFTAPSDGYVVYTCLDSATSPYFYTSWMGDYVEKEINATIRNTNILSLFKLNLYDVLTINGYINAGTGTFSPTNDTKRSTFIFVPSGAKIHFDLLGVAGFDILAFYTDKSTSTYVSGITGNYRMGVFTAPSDGYIAVCCLNSYTKGWLYVDMNSDYVEQKVLNRSDLTNKYVLNFGDSLADGAGNSSKSYADIYCAARNGKMADYSLSGGPLCNYGQTESYSCIVNKVRAAISDHANDDIGIIFVEGGINDLKLSGFSIGEVTSGYDTVGAENTICGALETIFKLLRAAFPTTNIVFVTYHHMPVTTLAKQDQEYDAFKAVCKKWSIPIADIYAAGELNSNIQGMAEAYFIVNPDEPFGRDIAHPNQAGYERFYIPLIEKIFN